MKVLFNVVWVALYVFSVVVGDFNYTQRLFSYEIGKDEDNMKRKILLLRPLRTVT